MKLALMISTVTLSVLMLFSSPAKAAPPYGSSFLYFSDSTRTVVVGQRAYCYTTWTCGTTSPYYTHTINPKNCYNFCDYEL